MAIYKSLPIRKKEIPLQARQWQFFERLWQRREQALPCLIALAVLGVLTGAVSLYARHYSHRAAIMLDTRPWNESRPVIDRYARSGASMIARLSLGGEALKQGRWDEAISYLEPVGRGKQDLLRVAALQNIALARWKKGEAGPARGLLKKLAEDPENPMADYSRLLLAEMDVQENQRESALKVYTDLAQHAIIPELRRFAEGRKKWLEKPSKKSSR